jgi:protease-4
VAALIFAVLLAGSLLLNCASFMRRALAPAGGKVHRTAGPQLEEVITEDHNSGNKVAVVPIEGLISGDFLDGTGYSLVEYVRDQLNLAADDNRVKAVILKVNSPGGEVLAADDISRAIVDFQEDSGKPVIVSMGSLAASGGYYVSAPCRWIVANELTLTGSIGVIMHSFNFRHLLDKVGVKPEVYKSGRFKDMLSSTRDPSEITPQEREMMQHLIDQTFNRFKQVVADGREAAQKMNRDNPNGKGRALSRDWTEFADGRVLSGKEAFDIGLVDELGSWDAAVERAKNLARIKDANLIEYHQRFDISNLFRLFGKAEPARLQVDLGMNVPKVKAGQLYFLSPTLAH